MNIGPNSGHGRLEPNGDDPSLVTVVACLMVWLHFHGWSIEECAALLEVIVTIKALGRL